MPIKKINEWLQKEKELGSEHPDRIVLATAGEGGTPHSRIVAIREITDEGILFFTQRGSRKTHELEENPYASMTLWLPLQQREVMVEGKVYALSHSDCELYWAKRPREAQLRFTAFAPTSGRQLESIDVLQAEYEKLSKLYKDKDIPMCPYYYGYRLVPNAFIFYTLNDNGFSEVIKYTSHHHAWMEQLLSP